MRLQAEERWVTSSCQKVVDDARWLHGVMVVAGCSGFLSAEVLSRPGPPSLEG